MLIHLHNTVDLTNKPEASDEPNGTCEDEEEEDHDEGVPKVQHSGHNTMYAQLAEEVVDAVDEQVESCAARCEEAAPPPVVILSTQVEVTEEHSGLRAGDHQDEEHQEQEAKHVVCLRWPDGVEDEEQLDEDAAEGQHPAHDDARQRSGVHTLLRDLPWDLVCPHWVLQTPLSVSKEGTNKGERHRHQEPEGQEGQQGGEGDGSTGPFVPQHQVHDEEQAKHNTWAEHWCQQNICLPLFTAKALVEAGGNIASREAKTDVQHHCTGH